jgi:hypothetical protein
MKGNLVPTAVFAAAVLACGVALAADPFRLLLMERHVVKWGPPTLGTGARVSYAFIASRIDVAQARNCGAMVPVEVLADASALPAERVRGEIAAAFGAWQAVAGIDFQESDDPATADIVIGALAKPRGIAYANIAYRLPPAAGTGVAPLEQALVCFNPAQHWTIGFDGDLATFDLRYSAMHEIGHAIGLDHPGPEGQLMSFKYLERLRAPGPGDIAGAVALYGPRSASSGRLAEAAKMTPAAEN